MLPQSFGGLKIAGNTTAAIAPGTAAKYTTGWAAHDVSQHGDTCIVPSAANSRIVCTPGIYKVTIQIVAETEDISGTSGDDAGTVHFLLYQAGAAVSGAKASMQAADSDRPQTLVIVDFVEITRAQLEAGTNYVELYVDAVDSSGNDITVSEAKFLVERLA